MAAPGSRPADPAHAELFTVYFPDCTYGSVYHEAGLFVHIKTMRGTGIHCPWMILDDDVALILGRELLGYPKKLGEINWHLDEAAIHAEASRRGHKLITMGGRFGEIMADPPPILGRPHRNVMGLQGGGAGLLITGNVMIDRTGLVEPRNVILDDERALPQFRAWAQTVHQIRTRIWMQINHPGRVASVPFTHRPIGPSAIHEPVPGFNLRTPRELSGTDIQRLIARFARTAELAVAAGFDGVQIHAAHGFLLSQFLSPLANTRIDHYGTDATGRRRLLLEIVAATRAAVGPAVPVSVKLNSSDFQRGALTEQESLAVAHALADARIDLLEISGGNYAEPAMEGVHHTGRAATGEAYFARFAEQVREHVAIPIMLTGGLRSREAMEKVVSGGIDLVGIARPMAFVPDYPARILAGEPVPLLPTGPTPTGYRPIDGYLQLAVHNDQFHRIAAGRTPRTEAGLGTALRAVTRLIRAALSQISVPT